MTALDFGKVGKLAHAAALGSGSWTKFLDTIGAVCGAAGGSLFTPGLDVERRNLAEVCGNFSNLAGYQAFWAARDPWLLAVKGTSVFNKAGEVMLSAEMLADAAVKRTAYYNEYARFSGCGHKLALKVCDSSDVVAPPTHLVFGRSFSDKPFTAQDKDLMAAIWPAVRDAVRSYWEFAGRVDVDNAPAAALDALPMAVFILREDCRIEFANARATILLRDQSTIRQSSGVLTAVGGIGASDLRALVKRSNGGAERVGTTDIGAPQERRLTVSVASMRDAPFYATAWPAGSVLLALPHAVATETAGHDWLGAISKQFRLTETERYVLGRLWQGMTVKQIAQERDVIPGTVRNHLTALFDKTGKRRQSELMRLASEL